MARTRVRIDLKLDRLMELTYEQPMSSMLWRKGQAVLAVAQARAPVITGNYKRRFAIAFTDTDRNVVRVSNDAAYAVELEHGTSKTPKRRTLGNALDAAGGA